MGYVFGVPGLSWASLDTFGNPERKKVTCCCDFGCNFYDEGHLGEARGCQGDANQLQNTAQRSATEVQKSKKIRHPDFDRPYGVLDTFVAFGEAGGEEKVLKTRRRSVIEGRK